MIHVSNLWITILLFAAYYGIKIGSTQNPQIDDSQCMTSSGQRGTCSLLLQCKTRRWMKPGRTDICWKENNIPVICCPSELITRRQHYVPVCGLSFAKSNRTKRQVLFGDEEEDGDGIDPDTFVVGGRNAVLGQYPWMAILYADVDEQRLMPICGATLITLDAVLTAAHCVHDRNYNWILRFAEHTLSNANDGAKHYELKVKQIIIHENYKPPAIYNDIAILKLERKVSLTSKVLPICLPYDFVGQDFAGENSTVAGWGLLEEGGFQADTLQEVNLPIMTNEHCNMLYADISGAKPSIPAGVTQQMLCAGKEKEIQDSCQGDSGGPLMIFSSSISRWIQVGIVSSGLSCGSGYPGFYTRLTEYTDWIRKTLG